VRVKGDGRDVIKRTGAGARARGGAEPYLRVPVQLVLQGGRRLLRPPQLLLDRVQLLRVVRLQLLAVHLERLLRVRQLRLRLGRLHPHVGQGRVNT
jgi:hypothetical protein